jgi:hypothetical protein
MSEYQQRERQAGTGVLLTNRYKKGAGPDWRGELKIERSYAAGETIKLAAWTKETAGGALISLKEDNYVKPEGGNENPFPSRSGVMTKTCPFNGKDQQAAWRYL